MVLLVAGLVRVMCRVFGRAVITFIAISLRKYSVVVRRGVAVDVARSIESYVRCEFEQEAVYVSLASLQCTIF